MPGVRAARSDEPPSSFEVGRARRMVKALNANYTKLLFLLVRVQGPQVKEHAKIYYGERAPNQNCLKPDTNVVWLVED